jgi:hypothetical protein
MRAMTADLLRRLADRLDPRAPHSDDLAADDPRDLTAYASVENVTRAEFRAHQREGMDVVVDCLGLFGLDLLERVPAPTLRMLRYLAEGELEVREQEFEDVQRGLAEGTWR